MKVLCPACDRLLELSSFWLEGDRLIVRCTGCNAESATEAADRMRRALRLEPAASAPALEIVQPQQDVLEVPTGYCPKCVSPRPDTGASCPQCGLVFANAQLGEFRPPEEVEAQWRELLQRWSDSKRHDQFLKAMLAQGELVAAGRLYRLRLANAPNDSIAQRGREEVVRLATVGSPLFSKEPEEVARALRWQHVALGAFVLLCLGVLLVLFQQFSQRGP